MSLELYNKEKLINEILLRLSELEIDENFIKVFLQNKAYTDKNIEAFIDDLVQSPIIEIIKIDKEEHVKNEFLEFLEKIKLKKPINTKRFLSILFPILSVNIAMNNSDVNKNFNFISNILYISEKNMKEYIEKYCMDNSLYSRFSRFFKNIYQNSFFYSTIGFVSDSLKSLLYRVNELNKLFKLPSMTILELLELPREHFIKLYNRLFSTYVGKPFYKVIEENNRKLLYYTPSNLPRVEYPAELKQIEEEGRCNLYTSSLPYVERVNNFFTDYDFISIFIVILVLLFLFNRIINRRLF